jgi:hypothetical protein
MSRTLEAHGLAVTPPPGWDARIYRRPVGGVERTYPVLHAATFRLPPNRGDYGDGAVQLMGPDDAFVALVEFGPEAAETALFAARGFPPSFQADDVSRTALQVSLAGHAGVQRWFSTGGRPWCLYGVIGSWDDRRRLVGRVNELVAGIRADRAS